MFPSIPLEAEDSKDGCILMMWGGPAVEKFTKGGIPHRGEEEERKEEAAEGTKC